MNAPMAHPPMSQAMYPAFRPGRRPGANPTLVGSILAGAGAIGFGCTLLPFMVLKIDPIALVDLMDDISVSDAGSIEASDGSLRFGFYDWALSSSLVAAAIPLLLLLALFTGGAMLAGFASRRLVQLTALASIGTVVLSILVWIRPVAAVESSTPEFFDVLETTSILKWQFGAGLYATAAMALVIAGVSLWSHFSND